MPSLIGITNLPNQRHKIASRKTQDYTILTLGQSGLGKTTFINTLLGTRVVERREELTEGLRIDVARVEGIEDGVKVRLNLVDCKGFHSFTL